MDTKLLPERLPFINSLTKYPSIPCWHPMGDRGVMADAPLPAPPGPYICTEKIDGTNARIILMPGCYLIGSREELLTHSGDVVHNPSQGIVEAVRLTADRIHRYHRAAVHPTLTVIYGEVFGGKVGQNAKNYGDVVGFRVFDIMHMDTMQLYEKENLSPSQLAAWRDGGGQRFLGDAELTETCERLELPRVPFRSALTSLPQDQAAVLDWLSGYLGVTEATDDPMRGPAEGVVVRTPDRSWIVKVRREDYEKAARRQKWKPVNEAQGARAG